MRKLIPILLVAFITVFMTSCGLKRMAKKYDTVKYEIKPEVLESHGGVVKFEAKGRIPAKYFARRATVTIQPSIKHEGGTLPLKEIKLSGNKVKNPQGTVINRKSGGTFTNNQEFNFTPEMKNSELIFTSTASRGKKTVQLGTTKVADGVIATSTRIVEDEDLSIAEHGYEKETILTQKANLFFDYNDTRLSDRQKLNRLQENINALNELKSFIQIGYVIRDIQINSWASPEGELTLNQNLSEGRGKAAQKWITDFFNAEDQKIARAQKRRARDVKRIYTLNVNAKGEDFDGFMRALERSSLPERQAITNVIKMEANKLDREKKIKDMTVIYAEIETILEPLRRAEIVVNCFQPKKTDAEIANLAISDPSKLDEKELLYAATLTEDMNVRLNIYKTATVQFPNSWKGFNNAGIILLQQNNIKDGATMIEKANALAPNNSQILNNMGVIASWRKDYRAANKYYQQASQAGLNTNYNQGVLKVVTGEYSEAVRLMSGKSCKYNLALAQLLAGSSAEAVKTLNCMPVKTAESHYLLAVIGARTANTSMMYDNLRKAISMKPELKVEAAKDREFIKYFESSDFKNAIK